MIDEKLRAVVRAQNKAAERALRLYDELTAALAPFVGKQVCKKDGLLAKVKARLPKLENTPGLMVYRHPSDYSLVWVVKACEQAGDEICEYREVSVYAGELGAGYPWGHGQPTILTALWPRPDLRCDYTPEEVEANREAVRKAQKALDEARSRLSPFFL